MKINWRVDQTNGDAGETVTIAGRNDVEVYHPTTIPEIRDALSRDLANTIRNAEPGASRALSVELAE